jgi:membrane protease YdiL (CAAX protease family)
VTLARDPAMSSLVVRPPVGIGAPRARASRARRVPRRALRVGRGFGHVDAVGTLGRVVARASGADADADADAPEPTPRGSNAESTISALDALLGVAPDPDPDPDPAPDAESASPRPSRAMVSSSPAETTVTRSRAEIVSAVRGALTDDPAPSTPSRRPDPLDAYDPEFDPLGLGPRWDVPWSWPTLLLTLVTVEASFYFAGALAPAIVYSSVREPDEIPLDDPAAFARDMQQVFDDPRSFADIVVCAEVVQTALALGLVAAVAASRAPLPPGWFKFSITGDIPPEDLVGRGVDTVEGRGERGGGDRGGVSSTSKTSKTSKTSGSDSESRRRRATVSAMRARSLDWFGEAARAAALTWGLVFLVTAAAYALGLRGDEQGTASNDVIERAFAAGPGGAASLVLTTVVLAPVLEETVFRGFLLPSLTRWMSAPWALGVSTLVFALAHEHNTGDTAQLLAVGAMAGAAYCRTRNLAASMAVHASFNLGVLVLFALWTHS